MLRTLKENLRSNWWISLVAALFLVFFISVQIGLTGCTAARKDLIKLSESDIKNSEALTEAARNLLKTWPLYSGIIKGAMYGQEVEFPTGAVSAMQLLDLLAEEEELSTQQLGYSLGLRIYLLGSTVRIAIERYKPDLLVYLPLLFIK